MTKKFTVEIEIGDKIQAGRLDLAELTVKDIEYDRFGHPVLLLNNGRKKTVFNLRFIRHVLLNSLRHSKIFFHNVILRHCS